MVKSDKDDQGLATVVMCCQGRLRVVMGGHQGPPSSMVNKAKRGVQVLSRVNRLVIS